MYNNTLGHGICTSCQHNTEGQHCEKCLAKYYRNMDVSMDDLSACIGKIAGLLIFEIQGIFYPFFVLFNQVQV